MTEKPKTRFVAGILWSVFSRWTSKGLGMINVIILARLLSPEDFGIVAMASIMINMLDSATQTGVHLYLFRSKDANPRLQHAVWTLTFIQAASIAMIMVLTAPWVASFYGEQILTEVLYCLALVKLLTGFNSIGTLIAQKQLNFRLDFNFTFAVKLVYLAATVTLAFWLQNFWAIIFGKLASAVFGLLFGYVIHPYRPKFDFYRGRELFTFSKSTIPLSVGRFINNQADVVVMGKVASTEFLGKYHMASNLAAMFTKELLIPAIRGLIPNLAAIQQTPHYKKMLCVIIASAVYVFLPIGMGLAAVAPELVAVLLGPQWTDAVPILAWLSLYCTVGGILMFVSEQFLVLMHKEKMSNRLMWLRNVILVSTIAATLSVAQYSMLPLMLFLSTLLALPLTVFFVARTLQLPMWQLLMHWWPAVLAALSMLALIKYVPWPDASVFFLLPGKVLLGVLSYLLCLTLVYYLRHKPKDSVEGLLLSRLQKKNAQ
tara:strand:+ start:3142 stop:4602 length:1461 start_codon:yes stop_codon:yes gene_type:complete